MSNESNTVENQQDLPPLTFFQVMRSTLAAFFGVQSEENRQRDFQRGKPIHYIYMGLLFTFLFILMVYGIVQIVLHFAGV